MPTNTPAVSRALAVSELTKRGTYDAQRELCTLCDNTPESHVDQITGRFRGCGAARRSSPTGDVWSAKGEYRLAIEDFPKRAIRSEQERIAYAIVKSLSKAGKIITSASLSYANPTWSPRDSYRLLRALQYRGILTRVGEEELEPSEDLFTPETGEVKSPAA